VNERTLAVLLSFVIVPAVAIPTVIAAASLAPPWFDSRTGVFIALGVSVPLGVTIASLVAIAVTKNSRARRFLERATCPACGYSLEGLTSDRCPECGEELSSGS
jgi:predicted RNA-binding Zn-ribbon protein involved in translation (DUF1610 family)